MIAVLSVQGQPVPTSPWELVTASDAVTQVVLAFVERSDLQAAAVELGIHGKELSKASGPSIAVWWGCASYGNT